MQVKYVGQKELATVKTGSGSVDPLYRYQVKIK